MEYYVINMTSDNSIDESVAYCNEDPYIEFYKLGSYEDCYLTAIWF